MFVMNVGYESQVVGDEHNVKLHLVNKVCDTILIVVSTIVVITEVDASGDL